MGSDVVQIVCTDDAPAPPDPRARCGADAVPEPTTLPVDERKQLSVTGDLRCADGVPEVVNGHGNAATGKLYL
jgi:hypothetical protein